MKPPTIYRTIDTNLVGALVQKVEHANDRMWPVNEPNAVGEHLARINAVWLDADGNPKMLLSTPGGTFFDAYAHSFTLVRLHE